MDRKAAWVLVALVVTFILVAIVLSIMTKHAA
jgi:hypothetical protein